MFQNFYPNKLIRSVYELNWEELSRTYGGVIFDIDNTLVPHGAAADEAAIQLFARIHNLGMKTMLVSNNGEARVKPFAQQVQTDYIYKAGKPKVEGYNPNPGDILYKDLDDNDIINGGTSTTKDPGDRKIIGNSTRRYQYGIHGGANWKGVSLSFLLQGVGKRDLWIMNDLFYPHYDAWTTVYDTQLNYWTPERTDSYFPRLYEKAAGNTAANTRIQTRYLQDGSYLSIRNITLSYNFPSKWMTKIGVNNLAVFFSGENLYTFDHLPKGLDPERSVTDDLGQRGFTYPYMRQYSFGINLSF